MGRMVAFTSPKTMARASRLITTTRGLVAPGDLDVGHEQGRQKQRHRIDGDADAEHGAPSRRPTGARRASRPRCPRPRAACVGRWARRCRSARPPWRPRRRWASPRAPRRRPASTPRRRQASRYRSGAGLGVASSPLTMTSKRAAARERAEDLVHEGTPRVRGQGQGHDAGQTLDELGGTGRDRDTAVEQPADDLQVFVTEAGRAVLGQAEASHEVAGAVHLGGAEHRGQVVVAQLDVVAPEEDDLGLEPVPLGVHEQTVHVGDDGAIGPRAAGARWGRGWAAWRSCGEGKRSPRGPGRISPS